MLNAYVGTYFHVPTPVAYFLYEIRYEMKYHKKERNLGYRKVKSFNPSERNQKDQDSVFSYTNSWRRDSIADPDPVPF